MSNTKLKTKALHTIVSGSIRISAEVHDNNNVVYCIRLSDYQEFYLTESELRDLFVIKNSYKLLIDKANNYYYSNIKAKKKEI